MAEHAVPYNYRQLFINPSIGGGLKQSVCVCICVYVSVCYIVILENALFHFLLNPLLERTLVLLINNCGDFLKNILVANKS